MRLCRIEVSNLLGLRQVDLQIDKEFQLIAGPNNAGKSSLVRLLETFFAGEPARLAEMLPMNRYYLDAGTRLLSMIRLWFSDLEGEEVERCARATLSGSNRLWVAIRSTRAGSISYRASKKLSADVSEELYRYILSRFHFAKVPSVRVGGPSDIERAESLERLAETLEAILIRSGNSRSTRLQQQFSRRATPLEELVQTVLHDSAASIQDELPFREGVVHFKLGEFRHALRAMLDAVEIETDDGTPVPVKMRGTGFQSALVLGILRHVARQEAPAGGNVLFAIEEPEAFLHPHTQRAMTRVLRRISEDAQVLVTTHSPIVIDSFNIGRTLRLPLDPDGLKFQWDAAPLSAAAEGRLTRWSNASNSELVFARTVVVVEGESDLQFVRCMLDELCGGPNEHHSHGVSVLAAGGLGAARNLIELATRFEVPSFLIADKDGVAGAANHRRLLDVLKARPQPPTEDVRQRLIRTADGHCETYEAARAAQAILNEELRPLGVFVLSSDLEGLVLDAFGTDFLFAHLGPAGEGLLTREFIDELEAAADPRPRLRRRLGSKGWDQNIKPKEKLAPHLPRMLLDTYAGEGNPWPDELRDLRRWLGETVLAGATAAATV